ncbi:UDP-glycosyltransferase 86A1-like [Ipomoea triloba]|uniref:UDP-glycosyltransferase 86A1-like n=1 Tax=Ipomoea triloba TaxID=35885 RepID=UPI00125E552F|nr:UDP-glycosyltransferase 86A1-like [Ipomoea triloba]XP_031092062.1 UDP-glycosyltransferase 86A1-like [Ipomoea triloba]
MAAAAEQHMKPHAIMVPVPLQGHLIPSVELALKLASNGFTITFINTQITHSKITLARSLTGESPDDEDIFSDQRNLHGFDIRYVTLSDGFPLSFDRSRNHNEFMEGLLLAFPVIVDEFIGNLLSSDVNPPVSYLIADSFFVWPSAVAKKHCLVHISFWTEPALAFTMYYHIHLLRRHGHFDSQDNRRDAINYIPGVEAIECRDLPSYLQDSEPWSVMHRYIFKSLEDAREADFVICNTVFELESSTITALQETKPFYAIGPIFRRGSAVAADFWPETPGCGPWLDARPENSVLYISFGSLVNVGKEVIQEIAHGLLQNSKLSFLWAIRRDITGCEETKVLPVGFEDEVRGRGLVVAWCSQIEVLSHSATGGFLTHCGWNSVLESVWCEVPMLCFPLLTDQFTNRKLVVDDWKVGMNMCGGKEVGREEVAENMKRLMNDAEGLRENMKERKKTLQNALSPDGSSEKNFEQFMHDIKLKIQPKSSIST